MSLELISRSLGCSIEQTKKKMDSLHKGTQNEKGTRGCYQIYDNVLTRMQYTLKAQSCSAKSKKYRAQQTQRSGLDKMANICS